MTWGYLDVGSSVVRTMIGNAITCEAALAARDAGSRKLLGFGAAAEQIAMHFEGSIEFEYPVLDPKNPYADTVAYLRYFKEKFAEVTRCVIAVDDLEPETSLFQSVGFINASFIPVMTAINAFVENPKDALLIHSGAKRTTLALFDHKEIKCYRSLLWGGNDFDCKIRQEMMRRHGLLIGPDTARRVKESIGQTEPCMIHALDAVTNIPRRFAANPVEFSHLFTDDFALLNDAIRSILESNRNVKNIIATGGNAQSHLLINAIRSTNELSVLTCQDGPNAVLFGMAKIIGDRP